MNFRSTAVLVAAIVVCLAGLAGIFWFRSTAAGPTRPNILVIMADDQRLDDTKVLTKTQALIAQKGTTFANAYVATPLCCPSRATFLTGQYAHNNNVLDNGPPRGGYDRLDHTSTLAVWMQDAGYYTAHLGKYLNFYGVTSPPVVPPGWTRWFGLVDPSTYQMYGYTVNDDGTLVTYGEKPSDYQTDVLALKAEEVIRARAGDRDRPMALPVLSAPVRAFEAWGRLPTGPDFLANATILGRHLFRLDYAANSLRLFSARRRGLHFIHRLFEDAKGRKDRRKSAIP